MLLIGSPVMAATGILAGLVRGVAGSMSRSRANPQPRDAEPRASDQLVRRHVRKAQIVSSALLVALPTVAMIANPPEAATAAILSAALLCFIGLHVAVLRSTWRAAPDGQPRTWLLLLLTLIAVLTAAAGYHQGEYGWAWLALPGAAASDVLSSRSPLRAFMWVAGTVVVTAVLVGLSAGSGSWWRPAVGAAAVVVLVAYLESAGLWLLRQTVQLERARQDALDLEAARERLRLAEDLHDVLGHTLEVVALKSELAERLIDVDASRARAEVVEVSHLARAAVQEVRTLVRARRPTDVAREVEAARGLLSSAGVACEVRGDFDQLPADLRDVLGRVVREAVTNLLRHADANRCSIELERSGAELALEVRNDGVRLADPDGDGSGLRGIRRRLEEVGGTLHAARDGTQFHVRARVPLRGPV
jgi:two-component system sensor histidine kinase DesK